MWRGPRDILWVYNTYKLERDLNESRKWSPLRPDLGHAESICFVLLSSGPAIAGKYQAYHSAEWPFHMNLPTYEHDTKVLEINYEKTAEVLESKLIKMHPGNAAL